MGLVTDFNSCCLYVLSKQTNSARQGKAMALSGAAVGTAAIVGPAFSGIMKATAGIEWVFITISILMVLGTIVSLSSYQITYQEKILQEHK